VAAELLELPEGDVPPWPEDEAAVRPHSEDVRAPEEREETAEVRAEAGELKVASDHPVRVRHLEDGAPSPRRADHVVPGGRDEGEADRVGVAAVNGRRPRNASVVNGRPSSRLPLRMLT